MQSPTDTTTPVTAADIDAAADRLHSVVRPTALEFSPRLSALTGARVYLKREDLQSVRSYKVRGAFNLMTGLDPEARRTGVVCASAGNHAQGVALACRTLEIPGRIYLPRNTPRQKRNRIEHHGGPWIELHLVGSTFDEAAEAAAADALSSGRTLVPPFDHPLVIAGQGTIAREILDQLGEPPALVVVPVGGGGLAAGVTQYLSEREPDVRVLGVEPAGAASMTAALAAGHPVASDTIDPFVDGAAVRTVGSFTSGILREHDVEVRTVAEGHICTEMIELYQNEGIITEPAGALAAAALTDPAGAPLPVHAGDAVVVIVSGGNNDLSRYGEVVERSLIHQGLKHYFLVNFSQEPGALRRFLDEVLGPDEDIVLFEYVKRNNRETGPALVGIELARAADISDLLDRMAQTPLEIERLDPGSVSFRFLT